MLLWLGSPGGELIGNIVEGRQREAMGRSMLDWLTQDNASKEQQNADFFDRYFGPRFSKSEAEDKQE